MPGSEFLDLPQRAGGVTHVLDKGLGARAVEDLLETAGDYVDIVKLGWGTAYVTGHLGRKLDLYRAAGKPAVCGGTFAEAVLARGKVDEYKTWLAGHGFTHVEVSDGAIEVSRERKLELIAELARDFTVLSEVGSKDPLVELPLDEWSTWISEELAAGAWKVITEAREGGTAGIFTPDGTLRADVVSAVAESVGLDEVIFEAPTKSAQAWFVKHFGPQVNLGNIPPDEVIPLETLRLGLRADTLKEVLLGGERAVAS